MERITIILYTISNRYDGAYENSIHINYVNNCLICGGREYKSEFYSISLPRNGNNDIGIWGDICSKCIDPKVVSKAMFENYINMYSDIFRHTTDIKNYLSMMIIDTDSKH